MFIFLILFIVFTFTFFIESIYAIHHFNYKMTIYDYIKTRQYAVLAKQFYENYKKTQNMMYRQKIIKCFHEIEKNMDVYDVRYNFGIDLIKIRREIVT